MKLLNKLKNDRQDLISNLLDNIESLEKLAFEQQAEIEKLVADNKEMLKDLQICHDARIDAIKKAKSEAIKEFAERLKATDTTDLVGEQYINGEIYGYFYSNAFEMKIDNLVKEMVGDDK